MGRGLVGLVLTLLVALGCAGIGGPEAARDVVEVRIGWPGAAPEEVETGLVMPAEHAVAGIEGVARVRSVAREGVGVVRLELLPGADLDAALAAVREALVRVDAWPEDAQAPVISTVLGDNEPAAWVVPPAFDDVRQATDRASEEALRLERLVGVRSVRVVGAAREQVRVEADPARLAALGLTPDDVASALLATNVELPGGRVEAPGVPRALIRVLGEPRSIDELGQIVLAPNGIRVADVCTVQVGLDEDGPVALGPDGARAVWLDVFGEVPPTERPEGRWVDTWTEVQVRGPDREATVAAAGQVARALGGYAVVDGGVAVVRVPGARLGAELPAVPGVEVWTGEPDWAAELVSPSLEALRESVDALTAPLPGVQWLQTDLPPREPTLSVRATGRVSPAALARALTWSSGREVTEIREGTRAWPVVLSSPQPDPTRVLVEAIDGSWVPVAEVAEVRQDLREAAIPRIDGERAVTVRARIEGDRAAVEAQVRRRLGPEVTLRVVAAP